MRHVSLDLETLGVTPSAPVIAIGAVFFDPTTGDIGPGFEEVIDFESACQGRQVDPSTIRWWLRQQGAARKSVTRGVADSEGALMAFDRWFRTSFPRDPDEIRVWGNGATFDVAILESLYQHHGRKAPWAFPNIRDMRTIVELAGPVVKKQDIPFEGTAHTALADATHQARCISRMWRALWRNLA